MRAQKVKLPIKLRQRIGRLTVTSLVPFRQKCDCGNDCARTRTQVLLNGVRSCGCGRAKARVAAVGDTIGIFKVAGQSDARWLVECTLCGARNFASSQTLFYSKPSTCRCCP